MTEISSNPVDQIRASVTEFRSDCLGFEYQIQGLFYEIETLYNSLQARHAELNSQRQASDDHVRRLERRQEEMHEELKQLRVLTESQSDLLGKLLK